ncbi:hypothetical protein Hanom_Chr14g01294071 [Helianthus anomalus]
MEFTSRMKMTRFQTFWFQMRKNKPLDESRKTGQNLRMKLAFYSISKLQNVSRAYKSTSMYTSEVKVHKHVLKAFEHKVKISRNMKSTPKSKVMSISYLEFNTSLGRFKTQIIMSSWAT